MSEQNHISRDESPISGEPYAFSRHINLSPRDKGQGWAPYIWLAYLIFFFIQPVLDHAGAKEWALTALAIVLFLALYFSLFWLRNTKPLLHLAGMVILGLVFAPANLGASTFFIFAAAFVPFCAQNERLAIGLILGIVGLAGGETALLHLSGWFFFYAGGFSLAVGGSNIYFAQRNRALARLRIANQEIEHLAKVAERERIARDLHDVLGHTLSVITLKSELAGKLMDRDPGRAAKEIREVEQISRQALHEVRDAIRGYRSQGLAAEIAQAKATLETAGVAVQCDAATDLKLPAVQESVLALAVREAVTNVMRHAQASSCSLRLVQRNGSCCLEIADNGRGGAQREGNGLRGMRERVEMLGGMLQRETTSGTRLIITLPSSDARSAGEDRKP